MKPRFPLKDIAFQAGLSLATVDRVLHERAGVRAITRARVAAAVAELERQYGAAGFAGRRFSIDVVMEAPNRFSRAVRRAFEAEVPGIRPATVSARFHLAERMEPQDLNAILRTILARGSHGVVLKAPARAQVVEMAGRMMTAGIPVLTYVTDLPAAARTAYIGMDNHAAGATAAWLIGSILQAQPADILVTLSSVSFAGEGAREAGFRETMQRHFPGLGVITVSEGMGLNRTTRQLVANALSQNPRIGAVYSIGGANTAVLDAFADHNRPCRAFGAHDLDQPNRRLLAARKLTFVLHHDLRSDARTALQIVLHSHRMLPDGFRAAPSQVQIATPFDMPPTS